MSMSVESVESPFSSKPHLFYRYHFIMTLLFLERGPIVLVLHPLEKEVVPFFPLIEIVK